MALVEKTPDRIDNPPHTHCAAAMVTGVAVMLAAVPVLTWLVNQVFALGR